jgi:hypothetical protein
MSACCEPGLWLLIAAACLAASAAGAQNRGVYPLGMSAVNSGVTAPPGFTYVNQLLFYSRNEAKDDAGDTLPVTGQNYVLMDMNTLVWVSPATLPGGTIYSAAATLPVAKNDLTSDIAGRLSGGAGLADSYYQPLILGWNGERVAARVMYGFLAPTGRFVAGGSDNVGSGYWTHAFSSGQTFYLTQDRSVVLSAFEVYELHTTQEGTHVHPGDTFDLDYSILGTLVATEGFRVQLGLAGYEQRQTTAKTGPGVSAAASNERYAINAVGLAINAPFPSHKASLGLKFFKEFSNRSSFQGLSAQLSGSLGL